MPLQTMAVRPAVDEAMTSLYILQSGSRTVLRWH